METVISAIVLYLLIGIPFAVMFNRAGKTWVWSFLILIPYVGLLVVSAVLAFSDWRTRHV